MEFAMGQKRSAVARWTAAATPSAAMEPVTVQALKDKRRQALPAAEIVVRVAVMVYAIVGKTHVNVPQIARHRSVVTECAIAQRHVRNALKIVIHVRPALHRLT